MKREPFIAHSELTNEIYIIVGKEKYRVTEQAIKAVKAIEALEQEPCEDVISREPFTDSTICEGFSCDECSFNRKDKGGCILEERVMNLPSAKQEPKTGYCKDCKYFEYDIMAKVDGIPLIVAHEICNKWGEGCKTKEDGYCFLFEPQESEVNE